MLTLFGSLFADDRCWMEDILHLLGREILKYGVDKITTK